MSAPVLDALDLPLVQALEYFQGVMAQGYVWACKYAKMFAIFGLVWTGIQVAMFRKKPKDAFWDITFKWVTFFILISCYPSIVIGIGTLAGEIGLNIGAGQETLINELSALQKSLQADVKALDTLNDSVDNGDNYETEAGSSVANTNQSLSGNSDAYDDFLNRATSTIPGLTLSGTYKFDSESSNQAASTYTSSKRERREYSVKLKEATLAALESVLVERDIKGERTGEDNVSMYVSPNLFIKAQDGNKKEADTFYLSPGAMLRVTLLAVQIMHAKNNASFTELNEEVDKIKGGFIAGAVTRSIKKMGNSMQWLLDSIIIWFCAIVLLLCVIFALIQYIMTMIEFTIVASIGVIFLPLVLFDGTKDIPKKLIPTFISYMVKIIVIEACMMFVFYLIIEFTVNTITDDGFNLIWIVADVCFNGILAYILTQNAPKIAETILTGRPQLSMGEAMQGAGTMAATAGTAAAATKTAARGAVNGSITSAGEILKMSSAAKTALNGARNNGMSKMKQLQTGAAAVGATATADLKDRMKAKAEKFTHDKSGIPLLDRAKGIFGSGGGTSGGAGSGGGDSAHEISAQYQYDSGKIYSTISNPQFQNAKKFDKKTNTQRNMTAGEFMDEKQTQGNMIGHDISQKMAEKNQQKNQENIEKRGNSDLGGSLTGGNRAT
jgi:type IV secretion system protein TrbL